jgi:hypothetical protein
VAAAAVEGEKVVDKDKATDQEHLQQIWKAIMAYKKAHGQVPNYLSDLVPEFLPDKAMLLSPVPNAYHRGSGDPKLPTSYSYEFSAAAFGPGGRPFREVKEAQMKEFGAVVPILRCFAHEHVINMAYSGDLYESELFWETSAEGKALSKKLGLGKGFDAGDFAEVRVVDDATGDAIAGAEVRLTQREYHNLSLPDRTLKTDAQGKVSVPLGPPPDRRLTVAVSKPGYFAAPETWLESALPAEKTWRLAAAAMIGGVVTDHEGKPLSGAKVRVQVLERGEVLGLDGTEMPRQGRAVETSVTDEAGRWRCESVPKNFAELKLSVEHVAAWQATYRCGADDAVGDRANALEGKATVDREALLGQTAEFRLEPVPVLQGVLLAPDGSPLAGEEVAVTVALEQANGGRFRGRPASAKAPVQRLKTDVEGRFSMPCSTPGELTLSASPPNLALVMRTVTVAPGLEPIQLKASARRRLTCHVVDDDGKPAVGVKVMFIGWAEASVEQVIGLTNVDGEFAWDAAPSDQIGLTFTGRGFVQSTEWVPAEKKDVVKVELRRVEREGN